MSIKRKKILLIAYSYPPLLDPQSIRWYHLSKNLANIGHEIDVITVKLPDNFGDSSLSVGSQINVKRVFPGIIEGIACKLKASIGSEKNENAEIRGHLLFKFLKTSYWVARRTMNNLLIGGVQTEWLPFCLSFLRRLNLNEYKVLITSQEPIVDSIIGLMIKKRKPSFPWIADMGDTFSAPYHPKWRKSIDTKVESLIVRRADRITLTNEFALKNLKSKYSVIDDKFTIIRQGFPLEILSNHRKKRNERFTMLFTGTFYEKFRDPSEFIKALSELDFDYELVIAGRNEKFMEKFKRIHNKVKFVGLIPFSKSLELQQKTDVLLHIGNKQLTQVPGKFFEYLGSKKPILCVVYNNEDETMKLTKNLNVGIVCKNKAEDIRKNIIYLYNLWKKDELGEKFKVDEGILRNYSWEANAEKLDALIRDLS